MIIQANIFPHGGVYNLSQTLQSDPNWSCGDTVSVGLDQDMEVRSIETNAVLKVYNVMPIPQ